MRIAIDISQIAYKGSGVSRFTDGLVKAICEYDKKNDWVFFFSSMRNSLDESIKKNIDSRGYTLIESKLPPTLLSFIWNNVHFFSIDNIIGKVDWLITSDWTEPPSKNKKATIVHDLVYLKYPDTQDALIRTTQEQRLRWVQKESSVIFADSDSTKHDLTTMLACDKTKVVVNYPGVFQPTLSEQKKFEPAARQFILAVGKLEPRKNLERLVNAFSSLKNPDIDLYIVGMEGWGNINLEKNPKIKLLGFVSEDRLIELYCTCLFFVMPSLYEGFGYPVVEAMSYGAPVATSNTSSLQEIAGDAALLFDPHQEDSIASALKKLVESKTLRTTLSKKGLEKSKKYSWKSYYEQMIQVLNSKS